MGFFDSALSAMGQSLAQSASGYIQGQTGPVVGNMIGSLFGGGQASLKLTGEEILDAGLQVFAQPPGKKSQSIQLLSGGEKALTAISLVFSLFKLNPAPFCLLDEVDAPLDEANVGRFNDLLRAMTDRSQFIVITHNKRTMQIADTLYGVTMEEPGISKLVSVNLSTLGERQGDPEKRRAFQVV